jgi:hypothetical protein
LATRAASRRGSAAAASTGRDTERIQLAAWHAKILIAIYKLGPDKLHSYEDIVVSAFRSFPTETRFQMRGYPEYPDSSDVHKPLYKELKADGYVIARDKKFGLTPQGARVAQALAEAGVAGAGGAAGVSLRAGRETGEELRRLLRTEAVRRFQADDFPSVIDTDFHEFFGTSVRTPNRDFQGRLARVEETLKEARYSKVPGSDIAERVRVRLLQHFKALVRLKGGDTN